MKSGGLAAFVGAIALATLPVSAAHALGPGTGPIVRAVSLVAPPAGHVYAPGSTLSLDVVASVSGAQITGATFNWSTTPPCTPSAGTTCPGRTTIAQGASTTTVEPDGSLLIASTVPPNATAGPRYLMSVSAYDSIGNSTTYNRDGTTTLPDGTTSTAVNTLNLSNNDYTVSPDATTPALADSRYPALFFVAAALGLVGERRRRRSRLRM